jgi:hypothetical protein
MVMAVCVMSEAYAASGVRASHAQALVFDDRPPSWLPLNRAA